MKIEFSKHALEQMKLRQIEAEDVLKIIDHPDEILGTKNQKIFQSVVKNIEKSYLIRIFVNTEKHPNYVITVYKTSKIDKYYEAEI